MNLQNPNLIEKIQLIAQLLLALPLLIVTLGCYIIKGVVRTATQMTGRILAKPLGLRYSEKGSFGRHIIQLWRDAWYDEIGKHIGM